MHVSETPLGRGEKPASHYAEGDPVRVRILRIEPHEQRIGLSSRDVEQPARETAARADVPAGHPQAAAKEPGKETTRDNPRDSLKESVETDEKAVPAGTDPHE